MFDLREFVLKTIKGMTHKEPDYKVRQYALGWHDKSVLTDEDMAAIEEAIERKPEPVASYAYGDDTDLPEDSLDDDSLGGLVEEE